MEFDDFESNFNQAQGSGDVQDFLRREQDALGEFAPPAPAGAFIAAPAESDFFVDDAPVNGFSSAPQTAADPFSTNASDPFGNSDNNTTFQADTSQLVAEEETGCK